MQSQASARGPPSSQQHLTRSVPESMTRAQFLNQMTSQQQQRQYASKPNDYVQLPAGPRRVEQSEEQPQFVDEHQLSSRALGRYKSVCNVVYTRVIP